MKWFLGILSLLIFSSHHSKNVDMNNSGERPYTYLALGDSYTIGEQVPAADNFPNQAVNLLQQKGISIESPRIIAVTGWTTDELEAGIIESNRTEPIRNDYDFVSLLIGVNDQYRGRPAAGYEPAFEGLLKKAIGYAGNRAEKVVVLSIPDWGITPFAEGRDSRQIATEIDQYNSIKKKVCDKYQVHFIDITPGTREAAIDATLLATDKLHPSGKEYRRWAERVAAFFQRCM